VKIATLEELDRLVPLETVQSENGPVWQINTKCRSCQVEIKLRSDLKPNGIARAIAAGRAPRIVNGLMCDECEAREEEREARENHAAALRERLSASNLPKALHGFYFNEMLPEEGRKYVVDQVRKWAEIERPGGMCLWGDVGTGKTRLAATAAWSRLQQWDVRWVSMPVLIAQLGAAFNDKARKEAISVLAGKGALILDDLDKINPSEWAINQVFAAIDTRLQAGAALLITTNLPPTQIGDKFGDAVMSRVAGLDVFELPGRDNRLSLEQSNQSEESNG
jgi:DNA replication protein DnaC